MTSTASDLLAQRRDVLEAFPETGPQALRAAAEWLDGDLPFVWPEHYRRFLAEGSAELVHESFWRPLPFGTGGVRGTVGLGQNRINPTVVCSTIQAHCDFLEAHLQQHPGLERAVVLANDVRVFADHAGALAFLGDDNPLLGSTSRDFSLLAARVYAANGFTAHVVDPDDPDALLTTPELSFLVPHLRAAGGVNISASHNPPDDNGIKVYDELGGQYLPPHDERLTDLAATVRHVRLLDLDEARARGLVVPLSPQALEAYQELYLERADAHGLRSRRRERVLFTPLCGCGDRSVGDSLRRLGFDVVVPDDQRADGSFASIPLLAPNPEVDQAMEPARLAAEQVGARLVLSTDPDADRVGVEVRRGDGWVHLTGNQIATLLAYRLLLDPDGPRLRGGVYSTIVTTRAVRRIAELAGCEHVVDDLLVGFKYIGAAIGARAAALGDEATDARLVAFAAEESHGYLVTPRLRDKDALSAAVYLAALHEELAGRDEDYVDYLARITAEVGDFGDRGRSLTITGSAGVAAISRVMAELRAAPPTEWAGRPVREVLDFRDEHRFGPLRSRTDAEARNVLVFEVEGARVTLRPSGTEPKLKLYASTAEPPGSTTAQAAADDLAGAVHQQLVPLFGGQLSRAAADLPDVLPLQAKERFEREVLGEARRRCEAGDDVAGWLPEALQGIVPGSSRVAVAGPALLRAAQDWSPQARGRLTDALERA